MEWIFDNDYDSFSLEIGEYITSRSILLSDITEATFMVKVRREDLDSAALVNLILTDGLVKVAGATESEATLKATFRTTDFGGSNLLVGIKYYIGLGIKVSGMTKFLEIKPVDDRLTVLPDFIHD